MKAPDVKEVIGEVAARHGITLRPDDPAFALVTVNLLVLEQAMGELVAEVRAAVEQIDKAAERVQARAGAAMADEIRRVVVQLSTRVGAPPEFTVVSKPGTQRISVSLGTLIGAAISFAIGLGVALALR